MTISHKIHLIIISIINLALIVKLLNVAWDGNDKAIILLMLGYPALIVLNGFAWLFLSLAKRPESKIYKITTLGLLALFLPTLMMSSMA